MRCGNPSISIFSQVFLVNLNRGSPCSGIGARLMEISCVCWEFDIFGNEENVAAMSYIVRHELLLL